MQLEYHWFYGLIAIPLVAWAFFRNRKATTKSLEAFIDAHLLPFLMLEKPSGGVKKFLLWSFVWTCFIIALAGPKWSYREVETLVSGKNLVIVLDLSESMDANDVKPSRMGVARQKMEDLIAMNEGIKFGIIGFAAEPHMLAPITEDKETLKRLIPSLGTDLVYRQGSKIQPALEMAKRMLANEPGKEKEIVIISDGGFENVAPSKEIVIHALGVGTEEGAPLKDGMGNLRRKNGVVVLSKLDKEKLMRISNGRYLDQDAPLIFEGTATASQKKEKIWEEHFYLFLLPVIPIFLYWFRKGIFCLLMLLTPLCGFGYPGQEAFEAGDFELAEKCFEDPYRKGVAFYRMGNYEKAHEQFQKSTREEVSLNAKYNLGNALAWQMTQESLQGAIAAYEDVLEKQPDHIKAKDNLEIVKKLLKNQQEQKQEEKKEQDRQDKQDEDAEFMLNRIQNQPKDFLKNKCYVESMKNGTKEEVDPW